MQPDVVLYAPKYRKLSLEIMEKIEFYVTKGNMGSKMFTKTYELSLEASLTSSTRNFCMQEIACLRKILIE
ncbi:1928_t:CDS:2, partial [Gigaspora rosea]